MTAIGIESAASNDDCLHKPNLSRNDPVMPCACYNNCCIPVCDRLQPAGITGGENAKTYSHCRRRLDHSSGWQRRVDCCSRYRLSKAANGREAIERAEQTKPDLIILVVAKPELDGLTAAKRLKQSMPEIRIILFTMYDLGQDRAKDFGVDAVVSKPEGFGKLSH